MPKGKAFVIVGHWNWGKSRTLRQLSDGRRPGWIEIAGTRVFVKRMSNDDIPKSLADFLKKIDPEIKVIIVIALCPNFHEPYAKTEAILKLLVAKYTPYFFVLKKCYSRSEEVTEAEIRALRAIGTVEVFQRRAEDTVRAKALKHLIKSHL